MPEESLDIVINAKDYASATLQGVTVYLRELGTASMMVVSNVATLTRELGLELPLLNEVMRAFHIVETTINLAGAAIKAYELLTRSATAATIAHAIAQHGLNAALAVTVGLLTMGVGLGLAAAAYETLAPKSNVIATGGSTHQTINVYFENRAPIGSEIDKERLLRDLGSVVAEKTRRAGYY